MNCYRASMPDKRAVFARLRYRWAVAIKAQQYNALSRDAKEGFDLALELAHGRPLVTAAREEGLSPATARRRIDRARLELFPRRGRGSGPLTDRAILLRLREERERPRPVKCLSCGRPLPVGCRRDRKTCSNACRKALHKRRHDG